MMKQIKAWQLLMLLLLSVTVATTLTACGDDEPKTPVVDYYLNVEEAFMVNGAVVERSPYYNPYDRMRDAMRKAYPAPNANGDDQAVIYACDEEYRVYNDMYTKDGGDHITCLIHLIRATKQGDIIKQSERLKTYQYDINPPEVEE